MASWLIPALKAVLPHVKTIYETAAPVFTKKKAEAVPDPTPLLQQCRARGLKAEAGFEMLVQQVPEYLRFFGFETLAQTLQADLGEVRSLLYPK